MLGSHVVSPVDSALIAGVGLRRAHAPAGATTLADDPGSDFGDTLQKVTTAPDRTPIPVGPVNRSSPRRRRTRRRHRRRPTTPTSSSTPAAPVPAAVVGPAPAFVGTPDVRQQGRSGRRWVGDGGHRRISRPPRGPRRTSPPAPARPRPARSAAGQTAAGLTAAGQTAAAQITAGQVAAAQTLPPARSPTARSPTAYPASRPGPRRRMGTSTPDGSQTARPSAAVAPPDRLTGGRGHPR
jgi:hypothetical protein